MNIRNPVIAAPLILALSILSLSETADAQSTCTTFLEDFESGSLTNWTIGGRKQGTWTANVVSKHGSLMGHLYHADFTEVTLEKVFAYSPSLAVSFDMEVRVSGGGGPTSNFYQSCGVDFTLEAANGAFLGRVGYFAATSSYPYTCCPSSWEAKNAIPPGVLLPYWFTMPELLSQISVNTSQLANVRVRFYSYASGWPYNMSGDVWVDGFAAVDPGPQPYCSAKQNSLSKLPKIGWAGTTSQALNNLRILLIDAVPNQNGLVFWGSQPASLPFQGGTMCVGGNITRGPLTVTSGTGSAFFIETATPSMIGTSRQYQWWYRDPQDPFGFGSGLSDSIEVVFCP